MEDLFEKEEKVLKHALSYIEKIPVGNYCSREEYAIITKEYGRLLRQLKRIMKISDKTAVDLNSTKMDLMEQINYDALTGIYNRRYMEEQLEFIVKNLMNSKAILSVLMLDVDFFKRFNDTYGHQKGDECLQAVAKALNEGISGMDGFVARYGGEEFVIILPRAGKETACRIAGKVLEKVRQCNIDHICNDASNFVTISAGVTTGAVTLKNSSEVFLKNADIALYQSKQSGRNRYTYIQLEEGII